MANGPSTTRQIVAAVVGAIAGALGALILGEYDFAGWTPYVSGVLFGLVIAEVILAIAHVSRVPLAIWGAVISGIGVLWAAWISSGRGVAPIPASAYAGVVLAMAVAAGWMLGTARRRS